MNMTEHYLQLGLCLPVIEHYQHWWIANSRLAWHIQITVRKSDTLLLILVWRHRISCRMSVNFLEQGLIVLQRASTSMKTQDTHKNILVVWQVGHCFYVFDMGILEKHSYRLKISTTGNVRGTNVYIHSMNMYERCTDVYMHICTYLWSLTRGVIRVSPKHYFADLVQNAMGLFKIPLGLFPGLIREVFLQKVKEIDCFLLQFRQLWLRNVWLVRRNIPIHALNDNLIAGVSNVRQFVQTWTSFSCINSPVDE